MSEIANAVTAEHFRYLAERTVGEDAFLRQLKNEARTAGIPPIWISPEQASFMQILLKLCKARDVVEIGTLAGYSAITMARALPPGGKVHTIEVSPVHARFAYQWIARSEVADRVAIHRGDARIILPTFAADSADAAFLDADKPSYPFYLKECLRIVRQGGLIMADNAFAFGELLAHDSNEPEVLAMRAFNDLVAREAALQSIIVPLGDGLWVGVKL
jgi:predicted O-methyltransferase YrrM